MEIPKDKILELLKQRGENDKAERADQELPDKVDPERDRGILERLGIDPQDLLGNLGGLGESSASSPLAGTGAVGLSAKREALERARSRLDRLGLYPAPVDMRGVRIVVAPWLFRVPGFRAFRGYATRRLIILKRPQLDPDLITHELCHIWQLQHRPLRVWMSYARPSTFSHDRSRYRANRYEREARRAVRLTRDRPLAAMRLGSQEGGSGWGAAGDEFG